jgi:hypothetical protein
MKFATHVSQNDSGAAKPVKDVTAELYAVLSSTTTKAEGSDSPISTSPKSTRYAREAAARTATATPTRRTSTAEPEARRGSTTSSTRSTAAVGAESKTPARRSSAEMKAAVRKSIGEADLSSKRGSLRKVF